MYPVPSTSGVFLLGPAALEPLPSVEIERSENSAGWMTSEYRYYLKDRPATVPTLAPGKQRFMDAGREKLVLIKIQEESGERLLLHAWHNVPNSSSAWIYNGTQSHVADIVGDEKVVVRTATLSIGGYAWVEYDSDRSSPKGMAYEFTVGTAETAVTRSSATRDAPSSTVDALETAGSKDRRTVETRRELEARANVHAVAEDLVGVWRGENGNCLDIESGAHGDFYASFRQCDSQAHFESLGLSLVGPSLRFDDREQLVLMSDGSLQGALESMSARKRVGPPGLLRFYKDSTPPKEAQ